MSYLIIAAALAQAPEMGTPCPPLSVSLDLLTDHGERTAYDCVAANPQALDELQQRISADPENTTLTRALAVWRMARLDEAVGAQESRTYNAADRRLLMDAVKAHRGRKSASAEHEAIFGQLDWYAPSDTYTDGRLTELDRSNLDMLRAPPEPLPEPEPLEVAEKVNDTKTCGCSAGGVAGSLGFWLVSGVLVLARRRQRPAPISD